jgi:hypothetical protein
MVLYRMRTAWSWTHSERLSSEFIAWPERTSIDGCNDSSLDIIANIHCTVPVGLALAISRSPKPQSKAHWKVSRNAGIQEHLETRCPNPSGCLQIDGSSVEVVTASKLGGPRGAWLTDVTDLTPTKWRRVSSECRQ